MALALAALLNPIAAIALVFGVWRIAAGLNWSGNFAISSGPFSHSPVWLGTAALLQFCAYILNRYGKDEGQATP